jgi:hypothetical protein
VAPTEDIQVAVETEEDLIVADVNGAVAGGLDTSNDSAIVLDDLTNTNVTVGELPPGEIILDTTLPGPTTSSTSPNVMTAVIATDRASDNSGPPSWLNWLAGSVIAIAFGLMMYRRRLGGQASTGPDAPLASPQPQPRFSDTQLNDTQSTDTNSIDTSEVDYDILDDSPTDENLILDADLVMGTGLSESSDPDISVDVGYAASKKLDIELPFEPAPTAPQAPGEWLPSATAEYAILESEVMPEHRNDDTKVTQTLVAGADADYLMLEQDYEDEMTATQALNLDVAHAAAELSARMEIEVAKTPGDETSALPLATVTELEVTAEMPARTGKNSGPKETQDSGATTANTTIDDDTIEMPAKSGKAS